MKKIAFICFALLIATRVVSAADNDKLELRRFYLDPINALSIIAQRGNDWKVTFEDFGVTWPTGSSVVFAPESSQLTVTNTRENILLLAGILSSLPMPHMVDIRMDFVEFKMDDIDLLTRDGKFCAKELLAIWKKGNARLLCSSQALTKCGNESISKGVTEVIYPTKFELVAGVGTNQTAATPGTVIPTEFEMRECGVILQVIPEISYTSNLINVMLNPQLVSPPVWKNYGTAHSATERDAGLLPMEVPFFHVYSVSTSVSVASGIPVLIGGGMMNRDGDRAVYAFLTATITDVKGNPVSPEVSKPSQRSE